ncbi:hypothetical protein BD408DRAFT_425114, partial [Parasitella parasitica]
MKNIYDYNIYSSLSCSFFFPHQIFLVLFLAFCLIPVNALSSDILIDSAIVLQSFGLTSFLGYSPRRPEYIYYDV